MFVFVIFYKYIWGITPTCKPLAKVPAETMVVCDLLKIKNKIEYKTIWFHELVIGLK